MDGGAPIRVTMLRGFRVSRGGDTLPVDGARLRGLVVRLALAGGSPVGPDTLIDAIWARRPPADPGHALQALVSRLRRVLGVAASVARLPGGYRLDVRPTDVDVLRFERLATAGRDRLRSGDPAAASTDLAQAVDLWGDHPGAEPTIVAAVSPSEATRLARVSLDAVADLADAELGIGRAEPAAERLTALLATHPGHERAAASLMDALAAQGRQAEALAEYERIRETLADTLGTDPGAALRDRHLRLLRAEQTPRRPAGNLPAPVTSFIGRADDLARVDRLLSTGRLVTVVGPGGGGKTRLAIEAARRRPVRDGAWLVDLASVTEPAETGAALLAAIGLRGSALFAASAKLRDDPAAEPDLLADELGGRECLLVLDNCEHLIDAVAHLAAALLARSAGLRILATSREPFAIDGEALVRLGPLPLPGPELDIDRARHTPAVRLFVERAAALRPGFDVDADNLGDVLRIVRSLDGIPLALELAAARLRTLSLPDLAAGLSDRFGLLTAGSRTAIPRHRTLRAVIAWSWDLLDAPSRTVAERIAVLPGGITASSAAALCPSVPSVADRLAGLVDRSLVQLAPDTGRYRMLETIREYGARQLAERGDPATARDLAATYFTGLVDRLDPLLRGPEQHAAFVALHAEYDNVLAALRRLCDTGSAAEATRLAVGLTWYWRMIGGHRDAAHWLGAVLGLSAAASAERDLAEGMLLLNTIDSRGALVNLSKQARRTKLRALTKRLPDDPGQPGLGAAATAIRLASLDDTESSATVVRRMADGPDPWQAGMAHMFRAQSAENEGRLDKVRDDVTAAVDCFARAGDRWSMTTALPLRALLRQYDGDLDGARTDLTEAKRIAGEFGALSVNDEIFIDLRLIDLHLRFGETARVAELMAATRDRLPRSAAPELVTLLDAREADVWLRIGEPERASALISAAETGLAERLAFGGDHRQALVGAVRGAWCLELGDLPGAETALIRAHTAAVASEDMPIVAAVAVPVAGLALARDRYRDAAVVLGAASRLRGVHDRTDPQILRLSRRARAALGDAPFTEAYRAGWRLDVRTAVARTDPGRGTAD